MGTAAFTHKLLQENLRQKEMDYERHKAVKLFADKLAEARERDSKELAEALRVCAPEDMMKLLLNKLRDVGYKEAVEMYECRIIS
ncbi:MAG: iron-containing alcohol dehydrogenase [Clostridia bacterium]|nr:iron-containing alcohol dehydrogenase [Clostridia bacterium]